VSPTERSPTESWPVQFLVRANSNLLHRLLSCAAHSGRDIPMLAHHQRDSLRNKQCAPNSKVRSCFLDRGCPRKSTVRGSQSHCWVEKHLQVVRNTRLFQARIIAGSEPSRELLPSLGLSNEFIAIVIVNAALSLVVNRTRFHVLCRAWHFELFPSCRQSAPCCCAALH
jgi:hypothetical protein